jgi:acyl-CoA thioesterase-1
MAIDSIGRRLKFLAAIGMLVLVASLISSCSRPSWSPLGPDAVILAFGDSLTKGYGAPEQHSYPVVMAGLVGRRVLNYGVSGETTMEGRRRLPDVLSRTTPNLVILMHGGNDILRNTDSVTTKENLAAMITMVRKTGAELFLVGIPAKSLFSSSADFYPELAQEYGLMFDGETVARLLKTPSMKSDLIHFNKPGYAELARRLTQVMVTNGVLGEP